MEITTSININARPEKVWEILMDFEKYPEWNPFVTSISGEKKIGKKLKVKLPGMTFTPELITLEEHKEFKWKGKLFIKGLFDGAHRFYLLENEDGSTHFEHSERFNGILVKILMNKIGEDTRKGFEEMNRSLKERAEK